MRKKNSVFNIIGTLGSYFMALVFNFITQAYIIKILGIEYSGINGLFTNILTMLSVAELGIGTTIIYKLYKPIADNNIEEIKSWMKFYKICYRYVAIFICVVGIFLMPFIPKIVGEITVNENIIVLYIISLLDIVFSYIMTYKRSLLYANQKNYIINIVHMCYTVLMNLTQILELIIFKNYVLYIIIKVIFRIIENIIINVIVNKKYTYIKESAKNIDKNQRNDVFKRIKAIFLQKVSFVINKGIDNVLISVFMGIATVGYYTNYNLVVTTICTIIYQIVSSMTASVGNLLTENNTEKSYGIYKKINMLNSFLTGICIVGFGCVIKPFICIWVGEKYLMSEFVLFSFLIYLYSDSIRRAITLYKEAAGICKEDQFMYVIMALINLISSIVLGKLIGVSGVILGTAISYLFLIIYSYPKYIFKPLFKKNHLEYYKGNLQYLIFIFISFVIAYLLSNNITIGNNLIQVFINGIIAVITTIIIFLIMFKNTEEFKYYLDTIKNIIDKTINRGIRNDSRI